MSDVSGWMDCAIRTRNETFYAGIIVDHDDGTAKFYIDQVREFIMANEALAAARLSRSQSAFRKWTHCYTVVGPNLNDGEAG